MKLIIAVAILVTSALASANTTLIKSGDTSISGAIGTIVDSGPICPSAPGQVSCMAVGTIVTVSVGLGGCLDNFGGYHHSFRVKNGMGVLSFGGLRIANKASMTARCVRMPTAEVKIYVPFEGQIALENLEYTVSK